MALFINGVGQDTFNMNGVSIDNLYVDGVLVWSSYVNTKPVISIVGDNPMYLVLNGSAYVEQGATAEDLEDGDITNDIVIGGDTPDVSVEGYYYVTYNVSDSEGLAADERTRTVEVYVVTVPKYELTEALINDGTFDYVPDSNNPESAFIGKLTESDGTTPYLPDETEYPRTGRLELANGRIMNTQFPVSSLHDEYGLYGIYDADGSTEYKIWALEMSTGNLATYYEGDQDTPIAEVPGGIGINLSGDYKVTEGRPSFLPPLLGVELVDNPNFDVNVDGTSTIDGGVASWESPGYWRTTNVGSGQRRSQYQVLGLTIGATYEADMVLAGFDNSGCYGSIANVSDGVNYGDDIISGGVHIGSNTFVATEADVQFRATPGSSTNNYIDIDSITLKRIA